MSWRRCAVGAVGGFGGLAMCVDVAHADSPLDMVQASNSDPNRFGHAYRRGTSAQEFPDLKGHNSYLAAFLTPDMYAALEKKRTARGSSIDSVIQAGVDVVGNPHTPHVGVYAGDEESYYTFSGLFHPIISAKHKYDPKTMFIPDTNPQKLSNASLNPQYILEVKTKTVCIPHPPLLFKKFNKTPFSHATSAITVTPRLSAAQSAVKSNLWFCRP